MTQRDKPNLKGPTPLAAHLLNVMNEWVSAPIAFHTALHNPTIWHESVREKGEKLMQAIRAVEAGDVSIEVANQANERLKTFLSGVEAYQAFPRQPRTDPAPFKTSSIGSTDLLHYGGKGPQVVFIPSLVNPAHILDLEKGNSLIRHLVQSGFSVSLIDWGTPNRDEHGFTLSDYSIKRLIPLIEKLDQPVTLAGYCMGGNFALAVAALRPDLVKRLALLATPWDFHADGDGPAKILGRFAQSFEPIITSQGTLPVECLQMVFAALDPTLTDRKFRAFAQMDKNSAQARSFVALEDWANSGAALAAGVARDVFAKWYKDNQTAQGLWRVGDTPVRPKTIDIPTLAIIPQSDRIVPPKSALSLAHQLNAEIIRPSAGHVGMIVGSKARAQCWEPFKNWLTTHQVALSEITA